MTVKIIYLAIGLLLFGGLIFFLISCNSKSKSNKQNVQQEIIKKTKVDPNNNPYHDLRNLALNATEEQIGVKLPTDQTKIYGVIMDWDLGEGTATLISFLSGDASLYLSSGGGIIGAGGHENVKLAVTAFIVKAEKYLNKSIKTETTPLPESNGVKFYFLTNKGKFVGQENMINFENNSSEWLDLFEEGNKLITEIRNSTPDEL